MTAVERLMGIGTATAAAAILAGVTVCGGSSPPNRISSFSTHQIATVRGHAMMRGDSSNLLDWLATRTMPRVDDAMAVRNTADRHAANTPPKFLLSAIHVSVMQAEECHPKWHPLAFGPVGREVANICPDGTMLPIPVQHFQFPLKLQLPKLVLFNSVFEGSKLDLQYAPRPNEAAGAGRVALHILSERQPNLSSVGKSTVERVPFFNPLSWTAAPVRMGAYSGPSRSDLSRPEVHSVGRSS